MKIQQVLISRQKLEEEKQEEIRVSYWELCHHKI